MFGGTKNALRLGVNKKKKAWRMEGKRGCVTFSDAKRGSMVSCTWTKGLLGEVADPKEDVHKCPD